MDLVEPERQAREGWLARGSLFAGTRTAGARRAGALAGLPATTLNCEIDGERFVISTDGEGGGAVRHGIAEDADAELRCALPRFFALLSGGAELDPDAPGEASALPAAPLLRALAPAEEPV